MQPLQTNTWVHWLALILAHTQKTVIVRKYTWTPTPSPRDCMDSNMSHAPNTNQMFRNRCTHSFPRSIKC